MPISTTSRRASASPGRRAAIRVTRCAWVTACSTNASRLPSIPTPIFNNPDGGAISVTFAPGTPFAPPPFPTQLPRDAYQNVPTSQLPPRNVQVFDPDLRSPRNQQLSLGYVREVAPGLALSVDYINNKGSDLIRRIDTNAPASVPPGVHPIRRGRRCDATDRAGRRRVPSHRAGRVDRQQSVPRAVCQRAQDVQPIVRVRSGLHAVADRERYRRHQLPSRRQPAPRRRVRTELERSPARVCPQRADTAAGRDRPDADPVPVERTAPERRDRRRRQRRHDLQRSAGWRRAKHRTHQRLQPARSRDRAACSASVASGSEARAEIFNLFNTTNYSGFFNFGASGVRPDENGTLAFQPTVAGPPRQFQFAARLTF